MALHFEYIPSNNKSLKFASACDYVRSTKTAFPCGKNQAEYLSFIVLSGEGYYMSLKLKILPCVLNSNGLPVVDF